MKYSCEITLYNNCSDFSTSSIEKLKESSGFRLKLLGRRFKTEKLFDLL